MQGLHQHVCLAQHFVAVAQKYVAPDGGVAGGYAAEVAKARACQREYVGGVVLLQDAVHERKGCHVRQVADSGKGGIVCLWGHGLHAAIKCFPHGGDLLQGTDLGAAGGGEDDLLAAVQVGFGVLYASYFFACNGVGWHKLPQAAAQCRGGSINHVLLGGAHVHYHCTIAQVHAYGLQHFACGSNRDGYDDKVGTGGGFGGAGCGSMDYAVAVSHFQRVLRGAVAHDLLDELRPLQCQRE